MTTPAWQPGFQGTFNVAPTFTDPHDASPSAYLALAASTGPNGYVLVNGTGPVIAWQAPADNLLHRVAVFASLVVGTLEVGGQIVLNFTDPSGTARNLNFYSAGQAAGYFAATGGGVPLLITVKAGTTVTLSQGTALTGGAATLWADIWAS